MEVVGIQPEERGLKETTVAVAMLVVVGGHLSHNGSRELLRG